MKFLNSEPEPNKASKLSTTPHSLISSSRDIRRLIDEPFLNIHRKIDRYVFDLRKGHYRKVARCREDLTDYAFTQFHQEERLMLHYGYDRKWTQSHISDHLAFWGLLDQLSHSTLNALETLEVVKQWLLHHHDSHDQLFLDALQAQARKNLRTCQSPEVAA